MKIWITGIAGFLGSRLAEELLRLGHEVAGNDSLVCGDDRNVPSGVKCLLIDCCDRDAMFRALDSFKPDVVYHCAATAHEGLSVFSPSFITRNIYEASVSTFSAAIAAGVKRIIYMSSMARYGRGRCNSEEGIIDYIPGHQSSHLWECAPPFKETNLTAPVDPYGIAKVAAEQTLKALCEVHYVEYVIAVPHNIIGIGQRYIDPYRNVAAIFINRIKQGLPIFIYGDGSQRRCFSPVSDCLDALVRMIDAPVSGEVINIGPDGKGITINELCNTIQDIDGRQIAPITYLPPRPLEVKEAYCSSDKARKLLGYTEKQSITDCLKEMYDWVQPAPFQYDFPLEIDSPLMPATWKNKL